MYVRATIADNVWLSSNYQMIMAFYHFHLVIIIRENSVFLNLSVFEIKIDKHAKAFSDIEPYFLIRLLLLLLCFSLVTHYASQ